MGIAVAGSSTSDKHFTHLDITDTKSIKSAIEKIEPDSVINCAAMTSVDECETKADLARLVNAQGPKNLAEACRQAGARLVHISTDSVFDGRTGNYSEDSKPNPVNTYAKTKLEGEKLVAGEAGNFVIVRTNLYGLSPNGRHLLNWVLSSLSQKKEILGFDDISFNPLWVQDLAICIIELAASPYHGIVHCTGDEIFTKYEFIRRVASGLGYSSLLVKRGSSAQIKLLAERPKNTTLSNALMHELLKTKIHTLDEVLRDASFDNHRAKEPEKI